MAKKNIGKYYIGLDIGTNSVGWAVTDTEYNLLRYHSNATWGVTVFDEGNQAADRRMKRTARRTLARRKQRINILQELFAPIIAPVDKEFFIRLKESALFAEDRSTEGGIFGVSGITDSSFHKKYPTIHHLILDLMRDDSKHDPRMVYMACSYILSHRGHFLYDVSKDNVESVTSIDNVYSAFNEWFDSSGIDRPFDKDAAELSEILTSSAKSTQKATQISGKNKHGDDYPINTSELAKFICGAKTSPEKLFKNDYYKDIKLPAMADFDEQIDSLRNELTDDETDLLILAKGIYDWTVLSKILDGCKSISEAKVKIYDTHKEDLAGLKYLVREYLKDDYTNIFKTANTSLNNYTRYTGNLRSSKFDKIPDKFPKCSQEEFCKFIKKELNKITPEDVDKELLEKLLDRAENNLLCPKQVNTDNCVIPYQLYYHELKCILKNAEKYIPELKVSDGEKSVTDKILSLMTFRIPYYVGPLVSSDKSDNAWMVRKAEGRILPWNFDELVDKDASEENFIRRMTCKCSYLAGEDVLPKNSLLYSKFCVLNEINNIKIDGEPISVEAKQSIYNDLFLKYKNVTFKRVKDYLISNGILKTEQELSGIDTKINSSMKVYHDMKAFLDSGKLSFDDAEKIIERITFTTDRTRLCGWLRDNFDKLSDNDINILSRLGYKDFGRLSKKLLTGTYETDRHTGEILERNIITAMWETNHNLMQLLSDNFGYRTSIDRCNEYYYADNPVTVESYLKDAYISSSVRRPIMRTLDIVKELNSLFGAPEKVFVELPRSSDSPKKRTESRRDKINAYFKTFKDDEIAELKKQLESVSDERLRSERLYLYFMQLGKCMYSGKAINIDELSSKKYDVDHIYPRSKLKNDSLDNKVLVLSELNSQKSDNYPISADIRQCMTGFWTTLRHKNLISETKYKRLTRSTRFTDEELAGFISRQLVETSQASKAVTHLLKLIFPETDVVYVKARNVSDFRHEYGFVKCREINDIHHAKDAYLNIFVGNVFDIKFTKSPLNFIKELNGAQRAYTMNLTSMLNQDISRGGVTAWRKDGSTLSTVNKTMAKNNIRYVRFAYIRKGGLFDEMPLRAKPSLIPRKAGLDPAKYGGYNKPSMACMVLVKYTAGKKDALSIIPIDIMYIEKFKTNIEFRQQYIYDTLSNITGKTISDISLPLGSRLIKINTMLEIDGLRINLTGKDGGGKYYTFTLATPLLIPQQLEQYIQKLSSFKNKLDAGVKYVLSEEHDKITRTDNLFLFDILMSKTELSIYKKIMTTTRETLCNGRSVFNEISTNEQITALLSMTNLFKQGRKGTCDLTTIHGPKMAGKLKINANISSLSTYNNIRLVDQSPTGLIEKISPDLRTL